jgi:hypothetical protein
MQRTITIALGSEKITLAKIAAQLYVDAQPLDLSKLAADPRSWTLTYLEIDDVMAEDLDNPRTRFLTYISQLVFLPEEKLRGTYHPLVDELLWLLYNGAVHSNLTIDLSLLRSKDIQLPDTVWASLDYDFATAARTLVA